ncbi:DUF218 domain-containing protein [Colletotrichum falcatum]|nr:DUF218 domain-containing protein [Colletotrichum falcatum]
MASPVSQIDIDAKTIYNYHRMGMSLTPATAIFCLCSLDKRVAVRGIGKLTAGRFTEPEAEVFATIARQLGVPDDKIIVEPRSGNTGENVRFTYALLKQRGLGIRSFVLVQKPYMERRTYLTFLKQWPDTATEFTVTSPELDFEQYPDPENPKDLVVNIMVGDLIRIQEYPKKGFQAEQVIPEEVLEANQRLIAAGFDGHLPT